MPNLLKGLQALGDTGGWVTDSATIALLNPGVRSCNAKNTPADLPKATNFAGGWDAPHIKHENWARHVYQPTRGGARRHMYCVLPRVAADDAARASRS